MPMQEVLYFVLYFVPYFVCKTFHFMFCSSQKSLPSNLLSSLLRHLAQYFLSVGLWLSFLNLIDYLYINQRLIGKTLVGGANNERKFYYFLHVGCFLK